VARINIFQDARLRVVFCPKKRSVTIVSKATDKGFIQPLNEQRWWLRRAIRECSNVCVCDGLKVGHHKGG
jgi:hypothetical protein